MDTVDCESFFFNKSLLYKKNMYVLLLNVMPKKGFLLAVSLQRSWRNS